MQTQTSLAHVDEVYEKLKEDLKTHNRVSVNMSFGLGKSIIAEKIVQDNPGKKILILTPTRVINDGHNKNLDTYCSGHNTDVMCYQNMQNIKDAKDAWDYVILDEYHHLGGSNWGKDIDTIIKNNPNCKFIGTTATPIRSDGINMSEELFEKNSSQITMMDAIDRGLLPKVKCHVAIYDINKEIMRIGDECIESGISKDEYENSLKEAKRQAEEANNISDFFGTVIPENHGKYIVFCSDIDQMHKMESECQKWFKGIPVEVYSVYHKYHDKKIRDAFLNFKNADASDKIVLMFNINMISEGYHNPDVDGIIIFGATSSIVKYAQQIGRVLDIHWKEFGRIPKVIDVVDNINDLKMIIGNTINDGSPKDDRNHNMFEFDLYQSNVSIVDILLHLHNLAQYRLSFYYGFDHAKKYFEEHGNLIVHYDYICEDGYELGYWLINQRSLYNHNRLSQDRIDAFNSIGMIWSMLEYKFQIGFEHAKKYLEEYGDLRIAQSYICEDGFKLGVWINQQRYNYKENTLSRRNIERLESIGMIWNAIDDKFQIGFEHAKKYFEEHGELTSSRYCICEDGYRLGAWVSTQRYLYADGKLSQANIDALESIGIVWDNIVDIRFKDSFNHAKEYFLEHKNLLVNFRYVSDDGFKLGIWIVEMRSFYKRNKLSKRKIEMLESIGMVWSVRDYQFKNGVCHSKEYFEKYGNLLVPYNFISEDGFNLGIWMHDTRRRYVKNTLTQDQISILESIGMVWCTRPARCKPKNK